MPVTTRRRVRRDTRHFPAREEEPQSAWERGRTAPDADTSASTTLPLMPERHPCRCGNPCACGRIVDRRELGEEPEQPEDRVGPAGDREVPAYGWEPMHVPNEFVTIDGRENRIRDGRHSTLGTTLKTSRASSVLSPSFLFRRLGGGILPAGRPFAALVSGLPFRGDVPYPLLCQFVEQSLDHLGRQFVEIDHHPFGFRFGLFLRTAPANGEQRNRNRQNESPKKLHGGFL